MSGMHVAPNPGPPVGKAHDVSFEKEKTLMRMITTEGAGSEAREGAVVNIHLTIQQPGDDGELYEIFNSKTENPQGLEFQLGCSLYSEAVERSLFFCKPGSVIDSLCTDPDLAADRTLGIHARPIPDKAKELWCSPRGPVGNAQGALKEPSMMAPKPEDTEPPWQPPEYVLLFHILLDAVRSEGAVPMYMIPDERLEWVEQRKQWASQLLKHGQPRRAMHHYKIAMLDLETPIKWETDKQLVTRNQLRVALHLNAAAAALKLPPRRAYPHLQTPKTHYDVHHDAIFHCTRVLSVDKHNVKALYRRAGAHLAIPPARHINGLSLAQEDLRLALEVDPQNADVRKELKRARELQKQTDANAMGMYSKMVAGAIEV